MAKHLFGIHDYDQKWVDMVRDAGKTAWCVHTFAVGRDPNDLSGHDFDQYKNGGAITSVARLNNGYGRGTGVIPTPEFYDDFAKRIANFCAASKGLEYVILYNEPNLEWEWPSDDPLTLANYMRSYLKSYDAIKRVAPHIKIAIGPPAPWNDRTPDSADWINSLTKMLTTAGDKVDWICLHAYTRGYDQNSFHTGAKMNPPWDHYHSGWEALYDYMAAIPQTHKHLPCLITECNGDGSWPDHNTGWVHKMYSVIGAWNDNSANQKILGACLFRWAAHDEKWDISRHGASVDMWREALKYNQTHDFVEGKKLDTVIITATAGLNLRTEPSGAAQVITVIPFDAVAKLHGSQGDWLEVEYFGETGFVHKDHVR